MKITLFQLAMKIGDNEPDGSPYATEAEAVAARATRARDHLESILETADEDFDLEIMCDYAEEVAPVWTLEELSDEDVVKVASAWDGRSFEAAIYPVTVEIPGVIAAPEPADEIAPGEFSRSSLSGYNVVTACEDGWEALDPENESVRPTEPYFPTERAAWEACDNHRMFGAA